MKTHFANRFRKSISILFLPLLIIAAFGINTPARGQEMTNAIRKALDEGLKVLQDPQYAGADQKVAQRKAMWSIVGGAFDFEDVSKMALAKNWRLFSAAEQKQFVAVFSELLGQTYIEKIQAEYNSETIAYAGEEMVAEKRGVVKTAIQRSNGPIPVDYKVRKRDNQWKIYDVMVEGVSLVKNYRTQFQKFLFNHKPAELIDTLKAKIEEGA